MSDRTIVPTWPAPAEDWEPALTVGEIHVWLADLGRPPKPLAELAATLSADERERAERFRFPEHRDRFVAGRGLLRELLGAYLGRSATGLRFAQESHGKPVLAGADAGAGLHFNLSHSGDGALYAIAHREVGVDLECLDRTTHFAAILDRVCTPRERALFRARPPAQEREAFFSCWTRKEAIAKALGSGLASGLQNWEVCFVDGLQPHGRVCLRAAKQQEWSVLDLPLGAAWRGALAAAGTDWRWWGWHLPDRIFDRT